MIEKPFSTACERNRDPILEVLNTHFGNREHVLEIGSGTGQHAVHFAARLPHLTWQTSDRPPYLPGIRQWLHEAALPNTPPPLVLNVNDNWPDRRFDAVFSANTLHIMSWPEVETLFTNLPRIMRDDFLLVIYGPFKYEGRHTSDSNAAFEQSLMASAPYRAIRDFEAVDALASGVGLTLVEDRAMPANNRCIVWRKDLAQRSRRRPG